MSKIPEMTAPLAFPAKLSPKLLLVSRTLGYGVGLLLPLLVGLVVAALYGEIWALALPIPFAALLGIAALFRPRAFVVDDRNISVQRMLGPIRFPLADIKVLRVPPIWPQSKPVSVLATRGLFGTYGWFWNREWSIHRIYLTDPDEAVELERRDGRRIVMTPANRRAFASAVAAAAKRAGLEIEIDRRSST